MLDQLARRYPIAMPAVGLAFAGVASLSLLLGESEHGRLLSLIAAVGALANAWALFRRLHPKQVSIK